MKKWLVWTLAGALALGTLSVSAAEKAPEDYSGSLTVYSPHDADPLNAGVQGFEALCQAALTGTGAARETALYRIEQIMAKENSPEALEAVGEYITIYNDKALVKKILDK